jgi:diguanylate cyclase (GGDEF)-like protein
MTKDRCGDDDLPVTLLDRFRLLRRQLARTRELAHQLEQVRALMDAGHAVNSARELDEVLQTILNRAVGLLQASTGSVMLRDGDELVVVAAYGNTRALHQRVQIGDAIAGRVAVARRPQLISGTASPAHFPGLPDKSRSPNSGMSVPMIDRGELVGVLNVGATGARVFTGDDVDLLCGFGELAATAIAKARLYEAARRATAQLAYSATHDSLTSLANRTLLADRITDAIRDSAGFAASGALLFIDIDDFKGLNDAYGHAGGDEVLRLVARRLRTACPVGGTPARVGGDELALFVPDITDGAEAEAVATKFVDAARAPMTVDGHPLRVTVSVGIALAGRHGSTYADLMSAADHALYEAKRAGKDCWRMSNGDPAGPGPHDIPRPRDQRTDLTGGAHVTR